MRTLLPIGSGAPWVSLFAASALWLAAPGHAATVGGRLVATTDYVFRGLTQTAKRAAVQGDVHLSTSGGWFAGAWGSFAGSSPPYQSRSELNFYAGRNWVLAPDWTASAHYARYLYPDDRPEIRSYYPDYDELQMSLSFQDRLTLSSALAPDMGRYALSARDLRRGDQWSHEVSLRQPVWRNFGVTAGLGYYDLEDVIGDSYWAWSGGVELGFERLRLTLTRFDVDSAARRLFGRQTADGHWALTAAWQL